MHVGDQSEQGASICRAVFATVLSHLLLLRTCEVIAAVVTFLFPFSFQETGFTCIALAILENSSVDQGGL